MTSAMPRLCRGLVVLPAGDGLLIEGAVRRQMFTGKAAAGALASLLPLLDGTRDIPTLAQASGLAVRAVGRVVDLLDDCDLLEFADLRGIATPAPPGQVASYLSRAIGATGRQRNLEDLLAILGLCDVAITGQDPAADLMAADLIETGVGTVKRVETAVALARAREPHSTGERRLIVVFDEPNAPGLLGDLVASARDSGPAVLRCARDGDAIEIGPLFFSDFTACTDCFRRGYQETAATSGSIDVSRQVATAASGMAAGLLAGLAGTEILALLARTTAPSTVRTLIRVSLPDLGTQRWLVVPDPECPRCSGHVTAGPPTTPGELYEWQMERPPAALAWAGRPPRAERQRHEALQLRRPDFPLSPRRALPADEPSAEEPSADEPSAEEPSPGGKGLTLAAVAAVLRRAVGLRSRTASMTARWTASGGNLGSVEAYVVEESGLLGLPGTIARYDDLADEVQAIRADPVPVARCLQGTGLDHTGVGAVVILVSAIGRLRQKYGGFAYRLAYLDAGCAAVSLSAAAAARGLDTEFGGWPDDLAGLLELDPATEMITAVVGLRPYQEQV